MISCILLSAGLSKRFGSPKALAKINGQTVIEHVQSTFIRSEVEQIIIVLGDRAEHIKPHILNHRKIKLVYNKDYNLGQTSSFQIGLAAVSPSATGIMLQPVDAPLIKPQTIDLIVRQFQRILPDILIPTYNGHKGHPPIFHTRKKITLMTLSHNTGLNQFEHDHQAGTRLMSVEDPGIIYSFNTRREFREIQRQFKINRQVWFI